MLYSVTKQQQQQQHIYDYISTKQLTTGVYNHQVKKSTSSIDDKTVMDTNPDYSEITNNNTKTDEDNGPEYATVDLQSRQIKTDDIKMDKNPAYAETKLT